MPQLTQRGAVESRQQTTKDVKRKVRRSRSRRVSLGGSRPALRYGLIGLCVITLLGWMNVYAQVTVAGNTRCQLRRAYEQEKLKNQKLRIKLDVLRRPQNVVAQARTSGMVYATQYEYIGRQQKVASAENGAGD